MCLREYGGSEGEEEECTRVGRSASEEINYGDQGEKTGRKQEEEG